MKNLKTYEGFFGKKEIDWNKNEISELEGLGFDKNKKLFNFDSKFFKMLLTKYSDNYNLLMKVPYKTFDDNKYIDKWRDVNENFKKFEDLIKYIKPYIEEDVDRNNVYDTISNRLSDRLKRI